MELAALPADPVAINRQHPLGIFDIMPMRALSEPVSDGLARLKIHYCMFAPEHLPGLLM